MVNNVAVLKKRTTLATQQTIGIMKDETVDNILIFTNPLTWLLVLVVLFIEALIKAWEWVGIGDFYFAYFGIDYSKKSLVRDVIMFACKKSVNSKTWYTKWRFRRLAIIIKRKQS